MWPEFADCQECVDEDLYVAYMLGAGGGDAYTQEDIDEFLKEAYARN